MLAFRGHYRSAAARARQNICRILDSAGASRHIAGLQRSDRPHPRLQAMVRREPPKIATTLFGEYVASYGAAASVAITPCVARVELNALDARSFIAFLGDKLIAHGVGR